MDKMTVSKLAAAAGVTTDTIRFYEKEGLISHPARSPSGYRIYDSEIASRVRFIKSGQRTGLKLSAIKELLEIKDQGSCPCGHTTRLIDERLAQLDEELARIEQMRAQLGEMKKSSVNEIYEWCCPEGRKEQINGKTSG
jgi:DNA-binding transcriptional MerR regulator